MKKVYVVTLETVVPVLAETEKEARTIARENVREEEPQVVGVTACETLRMAAMMLELSEEDAGICIPYSSTYGDQTLLAKLLEPS